MWVDTRFSLPNANYALVQTLGFTGGERSNGTQINVGGVPVTTPVATGGNPSYWNNLVATAVANALSDTAAYNNFVVDVKENTVIIIQPYSDENFLPIVISNATNSAIEMTLNAPSGWVDGVWFGENPWKSFLVDTTTAPALVEVDIYSFGFTGGERSNGSQVTVGGVTFTTPIANSGDPGEWNNELARLHVLALDSKEQYSSLASDSHSNTSILVKPRAFNDSNLDTFAGEGSSIQVSLNFSSGWNNGVWLGENPWRNFFNTDTSTTPTTYALTGPSSVDEGSTGVFSLQTTGLASGTSVSYSLSGVTLADLSSGALTGTATVNESGVATISVALKADRLTEGQEQLTVSVGNGAATASTYIIDTSTTPTTYALTGPSSVDEGSTGVFSLQTTGLASGTSVSYSLSGVTLADLSSGTLSGDFLIDNDGNAVIRIALKADTLTEGTETLTLSVADGAATASIVVNDTSTSTLPSSAINGSAKYYAFFDSYLWNLFEDPSWGGLNGFTLQSADERTVLLSLPSDNMTAVLTGEFFVRESPTSLTDVTGQMYKASFFTNGILTDAVEWVEGSDIQQRMDFQYLLSLLYGDDYFEGSITVGGDDSVQGLAGNDRFKGNGDNSGDYFFGGDGIDTAIYRGKRSDYLVQLTDAIRDGRLDDGTLVSGHIVMDLVSRRDGRDYLNEIERLEFSDWSIAFDVGATQNAGKAKLFVGAVANSLANDAATLGTILHFIDNGYGDLVALSQLAIDVGVVSALAGSSSNQALAELVTKNVWGQSNPLISAMLTGYMDGPFANYTQAQFLAAVASLEVNQQHVNLVGLSETGMEYIPLEL
jgi:hypothetical protein